MARRVNAPELRTIDASLPESLSSLVARCLDKVPAARPTAAALAVELAAFADADGAAPGEAGRALARRSDGAR